MEDLIDLREARPASPAQSDATEVPEHHLVPRTLADNIEHVKSLISRSSSISKAPETSITAQVFRNRSGSGGSSGAVSQQRLFHELDLLKRRIKHEQHHVRRPSQMDPETESESEDVVDEREEELDSIREQLYSERQQSEDLLSAAESRIDSLTSEKEKTLNLLRSSQDELGRLQKLKTDIDDALAKSQRKVKELSDSHRTANKYIQRMIADHKTREDAAQRSRDALKADLEASQQRHRDELKAVRKETESLREALEANQGASQQQHQDELAAEREETEALREQVIMQSDVHHKQVDAANVKVKKLEQIIADFEKRTSDAEDTAKTGHSEIRRQLEAKEHEVADLQRELSEIHKNLYGGPVQLRKGVNAESSQAACSTDVQEAISSLKARLGEAEKARDAAIRASIEDMARLKAEKVEKGHESMTSLKAKLSEAEEARDAAIRASMEDMTRFKAEQVEMIAALQQGWSSKADEAARAHDAELSSARDQFRKEIAAVSANSERWIAHVNQDGRSELASAREAHKVPLPEAPTIVEGDKSKRVSQWNNLLQFSGTINREAEKKELMEEVSKEHQQQMDTLRQENERLAGEVSFWQIQHDQHHEILELKDDVAEFTALQDDHTKVISRLSQSGAINEKPTFERLPAEKPMVETYRPQTGAATVPPSFEMGASLEFAKREHQLALDYALSKASETSQTEIAALKKSHKKELAYVQAAADKELERALATADKKLQDALANAEKDLAAALARAEQQEHELDNQSTAHAEEVKKLHAKAEQHANMLQTQSAAHKEEIRKLNASLHTQITHLHAQLEEASELQKKGLEKSSASRKKEPEEASEVRKKELAEAVMKAEQESKQTLQAQAIAHENELQALSARLHGERTDLQRQLEDVSEASQQELTEALASAEQKFEQRLEAQSVAHEEKMKDLGDGLRVERTQQLEEISKVHKQELLEALGNAEQELEQRLRDQSLAHEEELKDLGDDLDAERSQQLEEVSEAHKNELAEALAVAKQEFEYRIQAQAKSHRDEVRRLSAFRGAELTRLQTQIEENSESEKAELVVALAKAEVEHEQELQAQAEAHRLEIEGLEDGLRKELTALQEELEKSSESRKTELAAALASAEADHEQRLKVQATTSKEEAETINASLNVEIAHLHLKLEETSRSGQAQTDEAARQHRSALAALDRQVKAAGTAAYVAEKQHRITLAGLEEQLRGAEEAYVALQARLDAELTGRAEVERSLAQYRQRSHYDDTKDAEAVEALQRQVEESRAETEILRKQLQSFTAPPTPVSQRHNSTSPDRTSKDESQSSDNQKLDEMVRQNEFLVKELSSVMAQRSIEQSALRRSAEQTGTVERTDAGAQTTPIVIVDAMRDEGKADISASRALKARSAIYDKNPYTVLGTDEKRKSFEAYIETAWTELSKPAVDAEENQLAFAGKIQEYIWQLYAATEDLSADYERELNSLYIEKQRMERAVSAKSAADFGKAHKLLLVRYGIYHADEMKQSAMFNKLSAKKQKAVRSAEEALVSDVSRRLVKRRSQIATKHAERFQLLTQDHSLKLTKLTSGQDVAVSKISIPSPTSPTVPQTVDIVLDDSRKDDSRSLRSSRSMPKLSNFFNSRKRSGTKSRPASPIPPTPTYNSDFAQSGLSFPTVGDLSTTQLPQVPTYTPSTYRPQTAPSQDIETRESSDWARHEASLRIPYADPPIGEAHTAPVTPQTYRPTTSASHAQAAFDYFDIEVPSAVTMPGLVSDVSTPLLRTGGSDKENEAIQGTTRKPSSKPNRLQRAWTGKNKHSSRGMFFADGD